MLTVKQADEEMTCVIEYTMAAPIVRLVSTLGYVSLKHQPFTVMNLDPVTLSGKTSQ